MSLPQKCLLSTLEHSSKRRFIAVNNKQWTQIPALCSVGAVQKQRNNRPGGRWRPHRIATLFGEVRVRLPRLACAGCGCDETGISQPSHCRSTPELDQLQPSLACSVAPLSALMPYRVAADVLQYLLPIDVGKSPETLRRHTLQVGKQLNDAAAEKPPIAAAAITMSLDSTF
jgi:hypothetical protein